MAVRPSQSFHAVQCDANGIVSGVEDISGTDYWINAGFFYLRSEIFNYIHEGEELVEAPFGRLIAQKKLFAHKYSGFWAAMDTFKDKIKLDRMEARGECPWMMGPARGDPLNRNVETTAAARETHSATPTMYRRTQRRSRTWLRWDDSHLA